MASLFEAKSLVVDVERSEGSLRVLDGVSFSMETGEVTDLVGPSGSGKSTLLLAMARLRPMTSGELVLLDRPTSQVDGVEWRQQVVYVPQKATLFPGTVEDNLLAPWKLSCRREKTPPTRERMRRDLDRIGLDDVELERDMARLSGGQAARIALLRALLLEAPLTLLDEVDAALDDASASMVGALVAAEAREGRSFLRVRHRAPDGFATRRLQLAEGSLVEDATADETSDDAGDSPCGEER